METIKNKNPSLWRFVNAVYGKKGAISQLSLHKDTKALAR